MGIWGASRSSELPRQGTLSEGLGFLAPVVHTLAEHVCGLNEASFLCIYMPFRVGGLGCKLKIPQSLSLLPQMPASLAYSRCSINAHCMKDDCCFCWKYPMGDDPEKGVVSNSSHAVWCLYVTLVSTLEMGEKGLSLRCPPGYPRKDAVQGTGLGSAAEDGTLQPLRSSRAFIQRKAEDCARPPSREPLVLTSAALPNRMLRYQQPPRPQRGHRVTGVRT